MSSVQWAKVRANTISHPDGSSKSPLYTDGIILDQASSASSRTLNINSTSGELQSNDQGTTRPLMARAACIDNVSTAADAFLADTTTALTLAWGDYTHKVANPFEGLSTEYERGPIVIYVYGSTSAPADFVLISTENTGAPVFEDGLRIITKPDSSNNFAVCMLIARTWYIENNNASLQLFIRSDQAGSASAVANYVGINDGRGKFFS